MPRNPYSLVEKEVREINKMVNIPQLLKLCQSNYLQCVASFRILVYNLFLEVQEAISERSYCKSNVVE